MAKKIRFSTTDVRGHTDALREQGKSNRGGGFEPHHKRVFHGRIIALLAVFGFCILVYSVHLIALQAAGNAFSVYEPPQVVEVAYEQTFALPAPRGELYDRNGNKLVTNYTSYTLSLDYAAFYAEEDVHARNAALLTLLELCTAQLDAQPPAAFGLTLAEELFPLEGSYPALRWSDAAADASSETAAALRQTLAFLGMPDSSASQIVQYYLTVYHLNEVKDGAPLYTDEQITQLIRLYYNMDRLAFSPHTPYVFAQRITSQQLGGLATADVPGLRTLAFSTRLHLMAGYASHLLGEIAVTDAALGTHCNSMGYFVNEIEGKSGCELAFDHLLRGEAGEIRIGFDADGQPVTHTVVKQPTPGRDVYLTIDRELQKVAEDALRVNIGTLSNAGTSGDGSDCDAGCVVVTDPHTGELLALASYPTYNDIIFASRPESDEASSPYLNRALRSLYAPSELFHLVTAITGLDRFVIFESSVLDCNGRLTVDGSEVLCPVFAQHAQAHGSLGISSALTDGCSVFFAQLGQSIGKEQLLTYAGGMGYGTATGIELTESCGTLSALTTPSGLLATGDNGTLATPLQLCCSLNTILTGGYRHAVRVFSQSRSYVSGALLEVGQDVILSDINVGNIDCTLLRQSMQQATEANTLLWSKTAALRQDGVEIGSLGAACTAGTAGSDHALLLTYGERESRAVSICVVLEHGGNPRQASPTVSDILDHCFGR